METLVTPLTIGLAGGLMLFFSKVVPYDPVVFAWLMLAVFGGWEVMAKGAGYEYARALVLALKRRIVDDDEPFSYGDARSLGILRKALASEAPADVLFALDLLDKANDPELPGELIRLLDHPVPDVRRDALLRLERRGVGAALDARGRVRGVGPRSRRACDRPSRRLRPGREGGLGAGRRRRSTTRARRSAAARWWACCASGQEGATRRLAALAASPIPAERAWAARVVGEAASSGVTAVLSTAARRSEPGRAARRAGRRRPCPRAHALAGRRRRARRPPPARAPPWRPSAWAATRWSTSSPRAWTVAPRPRWRATPRASSAGSAGSARARPRSGRASAIPISSCGWRCWRPCAGAGTRPRPLTDEAGGVRRQLEAELEDAAWTLAVLRDLPPHADFAVLSAALAPRAGAAAAQAVLLLLSFLHDPVAILRAREGLAHGSREKRAYALEVLDVTLDRDLKPRVLAFLEDQGGAAAADARSARHGRAQASRRASACARWRWRPRASVSAWTTACAVQAAARLGGDGWEEALAAAAEDRSPLVRETAAWARAGGRETWTREEANGC